MSRKQRVDIVKLIPASQVVEGKRYYYLVNGVVKLGTAVRCEDCNKVCNANSMTITSFGKSLARITVAEITEDELSYEEDFDRCLCSDCIPPQFESEAI